MESGRSEGSEQPEFEALVEKSTRDGLRTILGESGLQLVLSLHPLKQVSKDPVMLHKILTEVFMENGAIIIEREVARMLLVNIGNDTVLEGRSRVWLEASKPNATGPANISRKDKGLLRKFLAPESLAEGRPDSAKPETRPIELTVASFASAFKKES